MASRAVPVLVDEASIDIGDLAVIAGELPPRALRLVFEWARAHQAELSDEIHHLGRPIDRCRG
jgi:hypothetical protein